MKPLTATVLLLPLVSVLVGAGAQERVNKKKAADFITIVDSAKASWTAKRYGACQKGLREALSLVAVERGRAIRAALPAAPAGHKIEVDKSNEEVASNPLLGALAAGVGNIITQRYRPEGGGRPIEATVTADSPLLQIFRMWVSNPAMLPKGSELIKYGPHSAVLKEEQSGKTRSLQIMIDNSMVEVRWPNADEDALFAMWDQAAVDKLAAVLGS